MVGYTKEFDRETTARILGREIKVSPKKAREVCRAIKGWKVSDAREYLEQVVEKKRPVEYHRFVRNVPHRKGDIRSGGYPVNVAKQMIKLLDGVESNADYVGLDSENLRIIYIAAHRGRTFKGYFPRAHGRSTPSIGRTTNIEIVVEETEGA
ncbi:MAG: 50S ribosomal protein L22 [Thermoplasmata archaeon]|nr:50S ribosomal protein L22 [Thermoplasmata archaeon]